MKKSVLFVAAVGFCFMASAQSNNKSLSARVGRAGRLQPPAYCMPNAENHLTKSSAKNIVKKSAHNTYRATNAQSFNKIKFGTSYNLFSALTPTCTQVTYNQDLGMIAFTHRESAALPYGSGAYQTDYSLDGGSTWDTATALVNKNLADRYPNGVILNPMGNSNPAMAYAISSGPHVTGSSWDSVAFSSVRLDGSNVDEQEVMMYPNTVSLALNVFSPPHFMSATDDSMVHSVQSAWTLNGNYFAGFYGAVVNSGVWNGATHKVTWTSSIIRPHFASYDGPSAAFDTSAELSDIAMAWSQDGKVGYVVFFGNLDSTGYNYASEQPIVYKSSDHGATWNMMPLYNFKNIPNLVKYLRPTVDSGFKIPFWSINYDSGYYSGHYEDVTVDSNYNLHIFGAIQPGAIANPDSGGYTFNPAFSGGRYIYDVYTTTASGGWQATFIDSLNSPLGAYASESPWATGSIAYGARIQASRNKSGSKVFCTWDDDFVTGNGTINYPDIVTAAIDVATNKVTGPTVVTNDADNFFLHVSDIAYYNGGCWNIPCVVIGDPSPSDGTTPIDYYFVQGVCAQPNGINEVSAPADKFTVSANYPNPFSKYTQFDVTLTESANVSVDVFDVVGQKVWSMNAGKMTSGKHTLTINNSFSPGVYFNRVTINNQTVTHKMIAQ